MKRVYIFIISLLFSCSLSDSQKLYEETMDELQLRLGALCNYHSLINNYKETEGIFPDSLTEVYLFYKHYYPEEINQIELCHFMDIFNKKGRWVGYFPIYDLEDTQIISYLLLSAGIDGNLNNVLGSSDKLHLDDWKQKLKLYNPDEFDDGVSIYSDDFDGQVGMYLSSLDDINNYNPSEYKLYGRKASIEKRPYSAKEEKSGNKDLLIYIHHLVVDCG